MQAWITTSWDDGHPLDLRVAEMLNRHGLPGTFYIPKFIPSGVMSEAEIRELAQSFEIGGHTIDHVFLPTIPDVQAQLQIVGCRKWIEDVIGAKCDMFCPPAGKFTRTHAEMIRRAGFLGLRTVELLATRSPRFIDGLMHVPTTLQAFPHPRYIYVKNAIKRKSWKSLSRYLSLGAPADLERLVERLLKNVIQNGGVFHIWGHSWEIERFDEWERLERVLKLVGQFKNEASLATNVELCRRHAGPIAA
jgi:peptidoglycan/xylan/chitin deacetylase (PgdA/CDA1 family)